MRNSDCGIWSRSRDPACAGDFGLGIWRVIEKKFKMSEPFWGLGGLIRYGGAGLLEVAGVGGTAGS